MRLPHCLVATASLLAALAAPASAKVERVVEKTFDAKEGVHLFVSTEGGDIRVVPADGLTVKVIAKEHVRASSDGEADEILSKLDLRIEQDGNDVKASASYEKHSGFHFGAWPPVEVDFIVSVPRATSVQLKTSGGDILVGDLRGRVEGHTSGGDVEIGRIDGDVDVSTSGGGVKLEESRGSARLATSGGNVKAGTLVGAADLRTSGGEIEVESAQNALEAFTSGGDVKVRFDGPLKAASSLSTSGGEVKVSVDKAAAFNLDASTSGGDVDAAGLTITIEHGGKGSGRLAGTVNGGGPELKLRSSGGDIVVASH